MFILPCLQRTRLGDVAVFENRQPVTEAKFITKSSLFILLLGFIRRLELKLNSEQKLRTYSSPRHIAKPPVVCRFSSTRYFLDVKRHSFLFRLLLPFLDCRGLVRLSLAKRYLLACNAKLNSPQSHKDSHHHDVLS